MARGAAPSKTGGFARGCPLVSPAPHAPDETGGFIGAAYGAGGVGGVPPLSPTPHAPDENYIFIGEQLQLWDIIEKISFRLILPMHVI
jgi:hypothetical protein